MSEKGKLVVEVKQKKLVNFGQLLREQARRQSSSDFDSKSTKKSTKSKYSYSRTRCEWSKEERTLYATLIVQYGRNFRQYKKYIKNKSIDQLQNYWRN